MLAFFGIALRQPRVRRGEHLVPARRRRADARSRRVDRRHPELRVEPGGHRHHDVHRLHGRDDEGLVHHSADRRGRLLLPRCIQLSFHRRQDRAAFRRRRRRGRHLRRPRSFNGMNIMSTTSTDHAVIRLHPNDDVVIATRQLMSGARIASEDLAVTGLIPPGHKIATRDIAKGEPVQALQPDHRRRAQGDRARPARPRAQPRHGPSSRASTSSASTRQPTDFAETPAHLHGHPSRRRAR